MRPEKESIVNEIREYLEDIDYVFFVDYRGLTVEQLARFRSQLRRTNTRFQVVKNAFLKCASDGLSWNGISQLLKSPTAMIFGKGDVTVAAKALRNFITDNDMPTIKGGRMKDSELLAEDIEQIASIPSREVLLGKLLWTIYAPMSQLAGVMKQKTLSLLYVLKAIEEKKKANTKTGD